MKHSCISACLSMLLIPTIASAEEAKFVEMLNGKDLSGWVAEGRTTYQAGKEKKPNWTIQDGMLHCAGKGYGFLRYDKKVCDFVFHLEFRMSPRCNSGIGIRHVAYSGKKHGSRPSVSGYELQLLDDFGRKPHKHGTMSLYRLVAPTKNSVKKAGEWNVAEITCIGPKIKVVLNDVVVHDIDQSKIKQTKKKPLCGYVSVQVHGHVIDYRNLKMKVLKAE